MRTQADNHQPGAHAHSHARLDQRRLLVVLGVTSAYLATELLGGYLTGSLALLSDAVHMLTDIAALCLGMLTLWISTRPASSAKTFGYLRAEILGALFNGLLLWVLVVFVWFEEAQRLRNPPEVHSPTMMAVATLGIVINSFSAWMTSGPGAGSPGRAGMAVRSVFVHVVSDLVGSIGVLIAGALTWFTGWRPADPVGSIVK